MRSNRGVALYLVLAVMAVVIVLANIVMRLMVSQAQITWHQTSRIRAQYAAMGGINYALEMLRLEAEPTWVGPKTWTPAGASTTHDLCTIEGSAYGMPMCRQPGFINPNDWDRPIRYINITISPPDPTNPVAPTSYPISVHVDYSQDQG